jgi:hypothetical protein
MVDVAANHGFYRANCLKRALVLGWFMRRRGIPCEIRIGTRKETGLLGEESGFSAHAWVESDGVVVNDHDGIGEHFAPFHESLNSRTKAV